MNVLEIIDKMAKSMQINSSNTEYFIKEQLSKFPDTRYGQYYGISHIAMSRNGGMIAIVKKSDITPILMDNTNPLSSKIILFNQAGTNEQLIPFISDKTERFIVLLDFADDERLYAIMNNGVIAKVKPSSLCYKTKGTSYGFHLDRIIKAKLFKGGFVALTKEGKFYVIKSLKKPTVELFFDMKRSPLAFEGASVVDFFFIGSEFSCSGRLELVFCINNYSGLFNILERRPEQRENDPHIVIKKSKTKKEIEKEENDRIVCIKYGKMTRGNQIITQDIGIIDAMALSPLNQLALFKKATRISAPSIYVFDSKLLLDVCLSFSMDFRQENVNNIEELTNCMHNPICSQVIWCGNDAIAICANRYITLLSITNSTYRFQMITQEKGKTNGSMKLMHCSTELDGIRVMTEEGAFFISKAPDAVYNTLRLEESPSRQLITCHLKISNKEMDHEQAKKELHYQLQEALDEIYQTALQTFSKDFQDHLIKAANFAKMFLVDKNVNTQLFSKATFDVKIIKMLRENGRMITHAEYTSLSIKKLIDLLLSARQYQLAETIAKELKYKARKIHHRWAYSQIKALQNEKKTIMFQKEEKKQTEEECFNEIYSKLKSIPNISYIKLYHKAIKYNKEELSKKFLQKEKSIPLLLPIRLKLKHWEKAMELAIESNDTYLRHEACDEIFKSIGQAAFIALMKQVRGSEPMALDYLEHYQVFPYLTYLSERGYFDKLFFFLLKKYFNSKTLKERSDIVPKLKDQLGLCKSIPGFNMSFYSSYIDSLDNLQELKCEVYAMNPVKYKKDKHSYDNSLLDVYEEMMLRNGAGFPNVENSNRTYKVNQRVISIMRVRHYSRSNRIDGIDSIIKVDFKKSCLTFLDIGEALFDYHKNKDEMCLRVIEELRKDSNYAFQEHKIDLILAMKKYKEVIELIIPDKKINKEFKMELIAEVKAKSKENLNGFIDDICRKAKINFD